MYYTHMKYKLIKFHYEFVIFSKIVTSILIFKFSGEYVQQLSLPNIEVICEFTKKKKLFTNRFWYMTCDFVLSVGRI